jgi:uncharacterized protein
MAVSTGASQEGTTEVISHEIRPGHEKDFDDWLRRILALKVRSPGYLGTTVISPSGAESSLRYVITRFRDKAALEAWRESPDRARFFEEVRAYTIPHLNQATGLETYFRPPGRTSFVPPPRWKITAITLGASFLISLTAHYLLDPYFVRLGLSLSTFLFTTILVILLAYLALPGLTRLLQGWLYPAGS